MNSVHGASSLMLLALVTLSACTNPVHDIRRYSDLENEPSLTADRIRLEYTQRGRIVAEVTAPEMRTLSKQGTPYDEFPRGIAVHSYNDSGRVTSMIRANYALYAREKKLWDARYDVVAVNEEGDTISTEQIFWNEKTERIYTSANVRIRKKGAVLYGRGLESDDRFTDWVIKEPQGIITIARGARQDSVAQPAPTPLEEPERNSPLLTPPRRRLQEPN